MIKLLVIADDFTGALDTGVQFQAKGTLIRVGGAEALRLDALDSGIQVLILDAETRHMEPEKAYRTVFEIVSAAVQAGIPCIYKKTDSGLRGNIGSELTAMRDASQAEQVHFIPAFPKIGRTTVQGVHYINQVPVADSMFGTDPFEPVRRSNVAEIIAQQSGVQTQLVAGPLAPLGGGILIYDAETDDDLVQIAQRLKEKGQLRLLSGCAGFAAMLPQLLELEQDDRPVPKLREGLLTVCGSVNPVTLEQLDAAERGGMTHIRLTPQQKLEPEWLDSPAGRRSVTQWLSQIQSHVSAILDCNGVDDRDETRRYAEGLGIGLEEMRKRISNTMGGVLERLLDMGLESTLLVTGGDTLLAFMRRICQDELIPICELSPGVVLSRIQYRDKSYDLISKSGGFGTKSLLLDLEQAIVDHSKEELVC